MRRSSLRLALALTATASLVVLGGCGRAEPQRAAADPSSSVVAAATVANGAASEGAGIDEPALPAGPMAAATLATPEAGAPPPRAAAEPTAQKAQDGSAPATAPATAPEPARAAEAAADPTPAPAPAPDPWSSADCLETVVDGPVTVLCRDVDAARAYAAKRGDPVPDLPRAFEGREDPTKPQDGLPLHRTTRRRIAPSAKFTPILFYETPPFSEEQWRYFAANRAHWDTARQYWSDPTRQVDAYKSLKRRLRETDKEALRNIILRNGYLYTEDRRLGRRIYKTVRLQHLFDEEEIWLQRGDQVYRLTLSKRRRRGYEHADGPLAGRKAVILLFDRVATSPDAFATTYHWDLQAVRHGLGLYTIQIDTTKSPTLDFRSTFLSGEPIEGALFHAGGKTAVAVAGLAPEAWATLYTDNRRRFRARERILDAAEAFADEWIKFDEPDIEFGQEDGKLRDEWEEAYRAGRDRYAYNGVEYRVFSGDGTPTPPQVCVDFLMDSIERASGTWWKGRTRSGADRRRTKGTIDWREFDDLAARSIPRVVRFAKGNPDKFSVYEVPESRQVKFEQEGAFFRNLEEFPVDFREGDMVVIYGYREDGNRHYHSFFVHMIDPIDGFPIILSDNAGLAAVRVWYDVMKTAPKRYVYRRLRILDEWLLDRGLGDGQDAPTRTRGPD